MSVYQRLGPRSQYCGTRKGYQRGCHCRRCRQANSQYQATIRRQKARGYRPLHAKVSATPTWRRIRSLKAEHFSLAEIARRLGLRKPELQWHTDRVTVRTEQRLQQFYEAVMAEGPELPCR